MNYNIEEKFIKDFVKLSYRDRLLFELKSSKKRLNALMRFSHDIEDLIKKEKIFLKFKNFDEKIKDFLKEQMIYVISFKYLEGIMLNINEMLDYIRDEFMPVIVLGNNIAIIKKEFEKGEYNLFLLKT